MTTRNKGGRPRVLTDADWQRVIDGLESGLSLRATCKRRGTPSVKSVLQRVTREREGFGERYAQAREIGLLQMEEEMLQMADGTEAQETDPKLANAQVQRDRLRIETRKWVMSKMRPDRYGDRVALAGDSRGAPIRLSNEDAAREVAMLLATAAARKVTAEREQAAKAIEEDNGRE